LGGGDFPEVLALAVSGSDLYAGGDFTMAGGRPAIYIAKWNGTNWTALSSGIGGGTYPGVAHWQYWATTSMQGGDSQWQAGTVRAISRNGTGTVGRLWEVE
jgi:hypothetical protein